MTHRLALLFLVLTLAACRSLLSPERPPNPPTGSATSEATPEGAAPAPVPPPPTRQYHLGNAASALVTQAHARAAAGDYPAATATLERALRIEPNNPLLWIELGRLRLAESDAHQAEVCGRKALALASGDRGTQKQAGQLLADALRAQRRNQEAREVESQPFMH